VSLFLGAAMLLPGRTDAAQARHLSDGALRPLWAASASRAGTRSKLHDLAARFTLSLPEDAAWQGYLAPGIARSYAGAAEYHGKLVLYGDVAAAAHQSAGGVVLWDGVHFEATPPISPVRAVTIWNDHIVVATVQADNHTTSILSLDGAQWDTLGVANQPVDAMTQFQSRLVLVGGFTSISGAAMFRVGAFDGATWSTFGNGVPASEGPTTVVDHAGTLVVGCPSSQLGHVLLWNAGANAWQTLGAGFDQSVYKLVSDGVNLFAAGSFTVSGTTQIHGVGRWDGSTWHPVAGAPSQALTVAAWNGNVVFPSTNGAARLLVSDGTTFASLPGDSIGFNRGAMPSDAPSVSVLQTWGTKLVVTGAFFRNGSVPAPGVLVYDGTQWSSPGEPWDASMHGPVGGEITDMRGWAGRLVIAGQFGLTADVDHYATTAGIVAWDGTKWTALDAGIGGTTIWLGEYKGDLIAAGWLTSSRASPTLTKVLRWNGSTWTGFGTGAPDFATSIQEFHNDLYIGSDFSGLTRWNGTAWSSIDAVDEIYALTTTSDSLVVAGLLSSNSNVAFWDGTALQSAGAGVNDIVNAATNWNGRVVIGGDFTASGGTPLPGVAIWDGTGWQPLGTNVVGVDRLRVINGELVASGDFKLPDDSIIETVARYTGSDWQILGSGSDDYVFEAYNGDLYQAGKGIVHGHVSHNLSRAPLSALLDAPRPEPGSVRIELLARPNPSGTSVRLTFSLPATGHARLSVVDVAGREVARLVDGDLEAGPHGYRWSAPVPAGIYFARLETPEGHRVVRLARLE
jgi:hypothetical protein